MTKKIQRTIRISQWIDNVICHVADNTGMDYTSALEKAILARINPAVVYRAMAREHAQKLNLFKELSDNWSNIHNKYDKDDRRHRIELLQQIDDDSVDN